MIEILQGDCRDVMRSLIERGVRVDAIVTDPPYELTSKRPGGRSEATKGAVMGGFMRMRWDGTGVAFEPETWALALDLLKPGGHLLAFGGTRTYHRLACAIEDAGFEIRDCIFWCYGSGFPKSLDVSKAIDKAAGVDREVIGAKYSGCGNKRGPGFRHDGDVDGVPVTAAATDAARQWEGWGTALKPAVEPIVVARKPLEGTVAENVLAHGTGALNIDGCRVEAKGRPLRDAANIKGDSAGVYGDGLNGSRAVGSTDLGRWPANLVHDGSDEVLAGFPQTAPSKSGKPRASKSSGEGWGMTATGAEYDDTGSAARFFYCAKASKKDRREFNSHPTVKPTDLMRWLVRMVTPRGGVVLDPFLGSGSMGRAAVHEGFQFIGIEREQEYVDIAWARIGEVLTEGLV